jgi:hypothetical protein
MTQASTATTIGCFLTNSFGERYLHAVNRATFNKFGAPAVFRQHFGGGLWNEDTLNIIVGTDSGLLVEHVNNHGVPPGGRFIFIEPPELLSVVRARFAEGELDKRIALCTPDDWKKIAQEFELQNYLYVEKLRLLLSVGAADAFYPSYRDLYRLVKSHLDSWIWMLRGQLGSATFIDCQLQNLAENHTPAIGLRDAFIGKTALILAGGPSLDAILPWARRHRDELVILAVSRISRRLLREELVPHLLFSIDPTALSFDISKEMLELDPRVIFVNAYHVHPPLLGQWRGRHLYLGERFPWPCQLNEPNIAVSGPTVTNTALGLAVEMGFAQIILGGVDLCHSPEGFSHAAGSNEHQAGPLLGHVGQWVETNGGRVAETEESLAQAVHDIGRQALLARNRGCRIVNPAPDAARIPNVDHVPLDGIVLDPLPQPVETILDAALPARDERAIRRDLDRVLDELTRVVRELGEIKKLALEGLECNDGLFGRDNRDADFRHKVRMDKIENKLDRSYKDLTPLVKNFGIYKFLRIVRPDRDKEWSDQEIETTGRVYYESYRDGAQAMLDAVENARRRVRSRRDELAATPDFTALVAQWRTDRQPGRARVWRDRHPERYAALDSAARQQFDALIRDYEQRLHATDTAHMARCRKQADLGKIQSKAALLFHHRDRDGLERMRSGLDKQSGDDAVPYRRLVEGYLAELDERFDDAINAYAQIGEGPLVEDVLLRISSLALHLERFDDAMLALDCLAALTPLYMPMYAEMLNLSGNPNAAAEVYAAYLERVPEDLTAMMKLAKLYTDQGVREGARWAYQHILEQDPDNAAVRVLLAELDDARVNA